MERAAGRPIGRGARGAGVAPMGVPPLPATPMDALAAAAAAALARAADRRPRLPVAGLDPATADDLLFRLRGVCPDAADAWLDALLLAQAAADAVGGALREADAAASFWGATLASPRAHATSLLLRCGPRAALDAARDALTRPRAAAATARLQARVGALRALVTSLEAALGAVHLGAASLWLGEDGEVPGRGVSAEALSRAAAAGAAAAAAAAAAGVEAARAALKVAGRADEGAPPAPRPLSAAGLRPQSAAPDSHALPATDEPPPFMLPPHGPLRTLAAAAAATGVALPRRAPTATARDALAALRRAPSSLPGTLPPRLAAPSRAARAWLPLTLAGAAGVAGALFLHAHSRAAGSGDLSRWTAAARDSTVTSWRVHVAQPLAGLRDELFSTLRPSSAAGAPAAVDRAEVESDRAALARMLADFNADHGGAQGGDQGGWDALLAVYESELRHPLRGLVAGSLARAMLVQVQQLKAGVGGALVDLEGVLRSNELTVALVAALPALALASLAGRGLARLVCPPPPDPAAEAAPARLAFGAAERALATAARRPGDAAAAGRLAADLDAVLARLEALFGRRRAAAAGELRPLTADVVALAAPTPPSLRAAAAARAARSYAVLRP